MCVCVCVCDYFFDSLLVTSFKMSYSSFVVYEYLNGLKYYYLNSVILFIKYSYQTRTIFPKFYGFK